jgi:hypothetical protein
MTKTRWQAVFQEIGCEPLIASDPLDGPINIGVEVEYFSCEARYNRLCLCLIEAANTAMVLRREVTYGVIKGEVKASASWEGELKCSPSFVRRQLSRLSRIGLWDLRDCHGACEYLDGEYYVVRGKDTIRGRENVLIMRFPEDTHDPRYRKVAECLDRLLWKGCARYRIESWISSIAPRRLVPHVP